MGIIDSTTYKITCNNCHIIEDVRVYKKSSNNGGSCWERKGYLKNFIVSWDGGGDTAPKIVTAFCKLCDSIASSGNPF